MTDDRENALDLEALTEQFLSQLRGGGSPDIEDFAQRHPEHAAEIREILPTMVAMEQLKTQKEDQAKSRFLRGPRPLRKLGDYRLLGEIGRGGMGIVYEAEQQSLNRHVAVKVLPEQSVQDPRRVERFEREARTAARLHHTNIVPIFGVGAQDGYHYYVMQFIRGLGLDRVIRELRGEKPRLPVGSSSDRVSELARRAVAGMRDGKFHPTTEESGTRPRAEPATQPVRPPDSGTRAVIEPPESARAALASPGEPGRTYWHSVARIGLQVADALDYAHSQGTLHRDIKPANLLLDEHGVVWVTDFGLAKVIADPSMTQSGDVVGTLQYMAPEQFSGTYDERSDIYGLGLTLYELLTLRPAYQGDNRSGLMHRVAEGKPAAPRQCRPSIPADLETIVLIAISREPRHRYQSAEAMRDDLQRFLEDRPILARRANRAQQAWRWCRRNRALASAILIAILAVLGATAGGWVSYVKQARANEDLAAAHKKGQDTLSRALLGFGEVIESLVGPEFHQAVIRDNAATNGTDGESEHQQVVFTPEVSARDADILRKILLVYEDFAAENLDRNDLTYDIGRAHQRMGDIQIRLARPDQAAASYEQAISILSRIDSDETRVAIATIHNQLGQVYAQLGKLEPARKAHSTVVRALTDSKGRPNTDNTQALFELARAYDYLGSWGTVVATGTPTRAVQDGRRRRWFGRPSADHLRGQGLTNEDRRSSHLSAQRLFWQLVDQEPDNVAFRLGQARSCRNFYSYVWASRGRPAQADAFLASRLLGDALEILRELVARFPKTPQFRYELAETLAAARPAERYVAELQEAATIAGSLREEFPNNPSYTALRAHTLVTMNRQEQDAAQRQTNLTEAIQLFDDLAETAGQGSRALYLREKMNAELQLLRVLSRDATKQKEARDLGLRLLEKIEAADGTGADRRLAMISLAVLYSLGDVMRKLEDADGLRTIESKRQAALSRLRRR